MVKLHMFVPAVPPASIAPTEEAAADIAATLEAPGGAAGSGDHEEAIRNRAYAIWDAEGRQPGHEVEHWLRARGDLAAKSGSGT